MVGGKYLFALCIGQMTGWILKTYKQTDATNSLSLTNITISQ